MKKSELKKSLKYIFTIAFVVSVFITLVTLRIDIEKAKEIARKQEIEILANRKQIAERAQFMGIVRGLTKVSKNMSPSEIVEVAHIIAVQCALHENIGLAPDMIFGLMELESNFDPTAISSADAYGLTQCLRVTFEIHLLDMGYKIFTKELALNPIVNIEVGIRELVKLRKYWLTEGHDNWMIPLTSYYWGIRWTKRKFLDKGQRESEYGKDVLNRSNKWREVGIL